MRYAVRKYPVATYALASPILLINSKNNYIPTMSQTGHSKHTSVIVASKVRLRTLMKVSVVSTMTGKIWR